MESVLAHMNEIAPHTKLQVPSFKVIDHLPPQIHDNENVKKVEIIQRKRICVPVYLHVGKLRCQLFHKSPLEVCSTWGKPSAVAC